MLKTRFKDDSLIEIGIDEAGRGCLWGPLMAGAVIWTNEQDWTDEIRKVSSQIKDSKKISPKKRDALAEDIKKYAIAYGIGSVSAKEIDTLGASKANQLAFRRAIQTLSVNYSINSKIRLCIDGILPITNTLENEECETIIDGDEKYISIAAASILAKTVHDKWVSNWCKDNELIACKYDLGSCKGYGTAKHRAGILKDGVLDEHRRLYLRKLIPGIYTKTAFCEIEDEI